MRRLFIITALAFLPIIALAQGYNSKGGSHRGYQTPYTQQEQQPSYWSGSGIALNSNVFATNNHVVDGATHLYVYFPETKQKYVAKTIKTDPTNDLAIVRITDPNFKGFPTIQYGFKKALEDVGTDVFVLGYPRVDTMGEEVKLTTGVVSSRSGFQGNQSQYQVSAPVQPGNSGGPLFNDSGELIGIVSAKHTDGAENVSYAVKLSYLNDLIASSGESISLTKSSQIASQKLSEKCKAVIPCTVMVIADNEREGQSRRTASYGSTGKYPIRINMPDLKGQNTETAGIVGIEIAEKGTAVYMAVVNPYNQAISYSINKGTYITDNDTGKKYVLKGTDNIEIAPKKGSIPAGSQAEFVLYFPAVPATVTSIDLCEPSDAGWQFKGVQIQ
jgi:Trypsin-like serine proteases, typically periplasmic, contain C-terminal PDZ domain